MEKLDLISLRILTKIARGVAKITGFYGYHRDRKELDRFYDGKRDIDMDEYYDYLASEAHSPKGKPICRDHDNGD